MSALQLGATSLAARQFDTLEASLSNAHAAAPSGFGAGCERSAQASAHPLSRAAAVIHRCNDSVFQRGSTASDGAQRAAAISNITEATSTKLPTPWATIGASKLRERSISHTYTTPQAKA